jgi:predicted dehydrogenase
MITPSLSRRTFLQTTGSAVAATAISRAAPPSANGKLQHACIGVGGMMGGNDLGSFLSHPGLEIVAICDVDAGHLEAAKKRVPNARVYADWRKMLAKEGGRIDSINVAVPDHMHAAIAMTALTAGKHVYCQKPLCHDVAEARALTEAAKRAGRVTQLGIQHASGLGDRTAVHYLRSGAIGKIKRVCLSANRPGAEQYRLLGPRPQEQEPPAGFTWDLWLGTAPTRPYAPKIYHPVMWRSWQDFGTGWSGDIGCHLFSAVWRALDLTAPRTVSAKVQESWKNSPERNKDTWPQSNHITWTFPGTAMTEGDELIVEWFDGEFHPPYEIRSIHEGNYPGEAAMFIGTEGSLLLPHTSGPILYPREKFKSLERPKPDPRNHYHHFVDACLGKTKTESGFDLTGPMSETVLLGTVAIRVPDTVLQWDAAAMKFPNHPAAETLLRRTYRDGWRIEGLG